MAAFHTGTGQTAYSELLRLLRDEETAGLSGTPTLRKRGSRGYWYVRRRLGGETRETYLGEDTPELRARLDRQSELREDARNRGQARTRCVRLLRAEGYLGVGNDVGPVLSAMAACGVFRLGGTLIGTHAFRLYEGELGLRIPLDDAAFTRDVDVAQFRRLSVALGDTVDPSLQDAFRHLKFAPQPGLEHDSVWRWRQGSTGTMVEFLTPAFAEEKVEELPALGVRARGLRHLNFLLRDAIKAAAIYRSGVLVQVPDPARFAVHKLIVADRRRKDREGREKAQKDRRQAALLIEALAETRPDELREIYREAQDEGPRWTERLEATLFLLPETRARLALLGEG